MTDIPGGNLVQYGAFGVLSAIVLMGFAFILRVVWVFGGRITIAVESIAPTIAAELRRQAEAHALERREFTAAVTRANEVAQAAITAARVDERGRD